MIRNNKIEILQRIIIDNNLKKYKDKIDKNSSNNINGTSFINLEASIASIAASNSQIESELDVSYLDYLLAHENRTINRFLLEIYRWYLKISKNKKKIQNIKLKELVLFFNNIKNNIKTLDKSIIDTIINNYKIALVSAEENNQIALKENIIDISNLYKMESILCASSFNRYINETDVIDFYNKASKHEKLNTNLKLTYIKNFIKPIPKEVSDKRKESEDLCVFDNYVIMHYDYNNTASKDTKEEIEKKKDPILFGVISGSNKLYYIADWIDDYCDLTLEKFIETIGHDVSKITTEDFLIK